MNNFDTLEAWTKIVIERFEMKINHLKIGDTGELLATLTQQLYSDSEGDVDKITFGFLYYGRFPDMGVGRGVKLGEAGTGNNRKIKPWFAKTFFSQVYKLGKILAEKTGNQAQIAIIEGIEGNFE
jgi:hypothetical protein